MLNRRIFIISCMFLVSSIPFEHVLASEFHGNGEKEKTSFIRIIAEPKSSRPFEWKRGELLTVGVRFVSPNETHVVGVATEVELVATKTYENRVEMMLRATPERIDRIRKAALVSEFWFEIMPFNIRHVAVLQKDSTLEEFSKSNKQHRPAIAKDWGWGGEGGRLTPPTGSELPVRKKEEAEQSVDTKPTSSN